MLIAHCSACPEGDNCIRWIYFEEEYMMLSLLESLGDKDLIDAVIVYIEAGMLLVNLGIFALSIFQKLFHILK